VSHQPAHVLLIEDNPGDADLIRLRLVEGGSGLDVSCVNRLSSGLESIGANPPAVVLLDLNLPDSHGAETFRNVLKKAPGVPVVVLSGQDDEDLAVRAVNQGVQDYLVKGAFNSKQLARAMRYAMERQALITSLDISRKQQLQFKDQFMSHVSHELRTPLTCIHQFVTILLDELAGPVSAEQREHLETVLRSVNQLRSMIGDLLEATRAESGKIRIEPRCVAIAGVVQHAVAMLRATAEAKDVGLEMGVDSRISLVYADPDRVLQVLTNLIDNAIKFTPSEGSVMVKACMVDADPGFVYVSVVDTGRGISPEARPLVFERMYQDPNAIDNSRKGLGLGLYIVQELVRLQMGRIWVESQLEQGSTFTFTLPLFSLAKVLFPVITDQGHLRQALTLITVELTPRWTDAIGNWDETRERCLELLRFSILPSKDLVLPSLGTSGLGETFLIVASTDLSGANVLTQRMREKLEHCPEVKAGATFKISAAPVELPSPETDKPLEKLVQEVADGVNGMVLAALQQNQLQTPKQPPTTPVDTVTGKEESN
jgi:sigma-B regulation protein RsbU (phosphoserine phosphatase)